MSDGYLYGKSPVAIILDDIAMLETIVARELITAATEHVFLHGASLETEVPVGLIESIRVMYREVNPEPKGKPVRYDQQPQRGRGDKWKRWR